MHRLLKRQIERHLAASGDRVIDDLRAFLAAVAEQYERADRDRAMLERLTLAVQGAQDGLWDWHVGDEQLYLSERYLAMLGIEAGELDGMVAWLSRVHEDDAPDVERRFRAYLQGSADRFEAEYRMRHADGSYRWFRTQGLALRGEDGKARRIAGSQTDITAHKEVEERLRLHAYHDPSTGYPNRNLLTDRLRRAIARHEARERPFAVVAIAIDAFDRIADSIGHEHCEAMVAAIAKRVAERATSIDTLARIRKDRLCFLIESDPDLTGVLQLTDEMQRAVQRQMVVRGEEVFTTLSMGIVTSDGAARTPEDYLHDAVVAMNRASDSGGGQHAVFDLVMHEQAVQRMNLEKELRRAIANAEFEMFYQPIVSLQTGSVVGFEALLRWNHPERGLLTPASFIDVAEEAGHLSAIFEQVLPVVLERVQRWQARARDANRPFVNVNLSRAQFTDPDLLTRIDKALGVASLAPHSVGFEMTESVMVEDEAVIDTLRALKQRRVRLLLDDFGTGFSCLANLRQFPLDSIKIDKSFVAEVGKSPNGGEIARAITTLAHSMAMDVTIEGIETEPQLRLAYNLGCEYAQGYHFARPLSADDAGALLEQTYRTSLTPPSSGTRPRNPQARGRVLLVDADYARQQAIRKPLASWDLEVVQTMNAHDALTRAESDLPDVIMVAMALPGMGALELCRSLRRLDDTAQIPLLLLSHPSTQEQAVVDCLEVGATDCISQDAPSRVLLARVLAHVDANRAERKLRTMAMTDEQTGVFTRRFLFQALRRSIKSTVRNAPRGLACLVVDADGFKHVNETKGHIDADALLQTIAATIDRTTRETDLVGRFGGAEFVVLLQDTDGPGARQAAEKIRLAVEESCSTTVSIGGAVLSETTTDAMRSPRSVDRLIAELLRDADRAKYEAKSRGKNRVVFIDDLETQSA